jgi:hypothetical protein
MAYVVVVNLCVLSESSMPLEGVLATCISSAFVTLVMGFWPRRRQDSCSEPFGATLEARITAFCHLAKLLTHLQQETWIAQSVGLRHPRAKKIRPSLVPLKQFTHEPDHRGYLPLSPLAFLLSPDQSGRWLVGAVGIEIASLISKSHRTKALPTALSFNCCQLLPTKYARRSAIFVSINYARSLPETCVAAHFLGKWATLPYCTKRTLCSESGVVCLHGRQAPKEHRREELARIRSGSSLCVFSGTLAFPSAVTCQVVRNLRPSQKHFPTRPKIKCPIGNNCVIV